jgi:DNA topoisomerase-1
MVLRRGRRGAFLGCGDYPNCTGTLPCDAEGKPLTLVKEEDVKQACPECGSPMVVRWKFNRAFLGCSAYPKCRQAASLPEGVYLKPPPKKPAVPAGANCPKCGKAMVIRSGKRGDFIACSGFPRCRNAMSLDKLDSLKAQEARKK